MDIIQYAFASVLSYTPSKAVLLNSCVEMLNPLGFCRSGQPDPGATVQSIRFKTLYYHYSVLKVKKKPIFEILLTSKKQGQRSGKITDVCPENMAVDLGFLA